MSNPAAALLADLEARGVAVRVDGDRLKYRPRDRVTPTDLERLHQLKPDLLKLLTDAESIDPTGSTAAAFCATYATLSDADRARLASEAEAEDPLAAMILRAVFATPTTPCAWRLYSHRLDRELWVVRDDAALAELEADEARGGLPVVHADDLPMLRTYDDEGLRDVLDALAECPGARVVPGNRT